MDIVKPQNIVKKKLKKKHGKSNLEKSSTQYILPLFCLGVSFSALFTSRKAVQLVWYEFSTFNNCK